MKRLPDDPVEAFLDLGVEVVRAAEASPVLAAAIRRAARLELPFARIWAMSLDKRQRQRKRREAAAKRSSARAA